MPFPISDIFLLFILLISPTLGIFQSQVDNTLALTSDFPLDNSPVDPFNKHLTDSDQTIDGNEDDDSEVGFQLRLDPLTDNTESPTYANGGSLECANPTAQSLSKFRRSRLNKRQKSLCPWQEFRDPKSPTSPPERKQGSSPLTDSDRIWPKLDRKTSLYRLLYQLERAPGTNGESNLNVCEGTAGRTIPVCFPFRINYPRVLRTPVNVVEPCRFCKRFLPPPTCRVDSSHCPLFLDEPENLSGMRLLTLTDLVVYLPCVGLRTDVCIEDYEELWCCAAAKKRITEHLDISPSDFEVSQSLRGRQWMARVGGWLATLG